MKFFKIGKGKVAFEKLLAQGDYLTRLANTKMCFPAGTLVAAQHGPQAIENIRPDDLVWSRCPETGVVALKPVVQVFVTHPDRLYHLVTRSGMSSGEDGDEEEHSISTTGEHPFWVVDKRAFLPASELNPGDTFLTREGSHETLSFVRIEHAPLGETFTTYNFEVADFHTYFAGTSEIWVHNRGDFCERLFSLFDRFVKQANGNPWQAHTLAIERFDGLIRYDPRLANNSVSRVQLFTEARRRHFSDLGGSIPPWRQGGQSVTLTPQTADNIAMATELRRNMRNIYKCDPEGSGLAAHHIVAHTKQGPDWDRARQILANNNVHLNEAANGIYVPHTRRTADAYPSLGKIHGNFHSNEIAKIIADRLESVAHGGKSEYKMSYNE